MKKLIVGFVLLGLLSITNNSFAQCSMCRQAAATNIESGKGQGRGLNKGILFLMSVPYLLGGTAGFIYWKNRKKIKSFVNN